jgi:hypothetical protein
MVKSTGYLAMSIMLTQQTATQISAAVKTLNSKNIHNAVLAMVFQSFEFACL